MEVIKSAEEIIEGVPKKKYTESLFYEISLTAKYCKKVGEQYFKKLNTGLTTEEFCVLDITYYEDKKICQSDLALALLVNRANMGKILDHLEKRGYIKREVTTKQNRPVKIVILTKEGEDVYIKTLNALRPGIQKMIQFITNKETDSIIKSLRRIRQAVKESIEIDI